MLKRVWTVTWRTGLILLIATIVGTLLLCAAYAIPTNKMTENFRESAVILGQEVDLSQFDGLDLDYINDAFLLNVAYNDWLLPKTNLLDKAISNYVASVNGTSGYGIESINALANAEEVKLDWYWSYGRYWHGYLIFLKPLLTIFNINQIRILNIVLMTILVFGVIVTMYFKCRPLLIPYVLSFIMIKPFAITLSIMFYPCFYIYNLGVLIILLTYSRVHKKINFIYLFLVIGIITCYFDMLTYPLLTLLMPAIVLVFMLGEEGKNKRERFKCLTIMAVFWLIGYAGFYLIKWCIGAILVDHNFIITAFDAMFYRVNGSGRWGEELPDSPWYFVIYNCCYRFLGGNRKAIILCYLFVILLLYLSCKKARQIYFNFSLNFCYMLIMISPYVWYLLIINHSCMHVHFASRLQVATIFAGLAWFVSCFEPVKKQINKINENVNMIPALSRRERLKEFVCVQPWQFSMLLAGICLMLAYVVNLPWKWAIFTRSIKPYGVLIIKYILYGLSIIVLLIGVIRQCLYNKRKSA